tara:strand:- start:128762 stop:129019 length:258 start_codon:yes stop_codon:yes gene_type:complete
MIKFKCKKNFRRMWIDDNCLRPLDKESILFKKGDWYVVNETSNYNVVRYGGEVYDSWAISFVRFKEHFYSIEELREMEINEIIDD